MYYYPAFLNINRKKCVVFGSGKVAKRRIRELIKCGADVHVYTRSHNSINHPRVVIHKKFSEKLLRNAVLIFVATNDHAFNTKIYRIAEKLNIPVNVADAPENCSFIVPSILRRKDLTIAISTGGKFPALSKAIRGWLGTKLGKEFGELLSGLVRIREKLHKRLNKSSQRIKIIKEGKLLDLLKKIERQRYGFKEIQTYLKNENKRIEKILRGVQ